MPRSSIRTISAARIGRMLLVCLVLLVGAGATLAATQARRSQLEAEYETRYAVAREDARRQVEVGMNRYAAVLHSAAGLINASEDVTQAEFERYGQSLGLARDYPGMERIAMLESFSWDERDAVAAQLAARGASLQIADDQPHELVVATLLTSDAQRLTGVDVGGDMSRRIALDRARDTGEVSMTPPVVRLVDQADGGPQPWSFALYAPIYGTPVPPDSVVERRASHVGWVSSAIRVDDMLTALGLDAGNVEIAILEDPDLGFDGVIASTLPADEVFAADQVVIERLDLFGRTWFLAVSPAPSLGVPGDDWQQTLLAGTGSTIALVALVSILLSQRTRLRDEVEAAVAQMREVNVRLERDADVQRALLLSLQVGVMSTDTMGNVEAYNLASEGLYDGPLRPEDGKSWSELLGLYDPETNELLENHHNPLIRSLRGERVRDQEILVKRDGVSRIIRCHGQPILDADEEITGAVISIHDITELRAETHRLVEKAMHDELTGLANRAKLLERLDLALVQAEHNGADVVVLYLDLDGFKPVNDTYGHDAGDRVLKQVAARLRDTVRGSDTAARLGGDEFVVLCDDIRATGGVQHVVARIEASMRLPFEVDGEFVDVGVTIGAAQNRPGDDPASLLQRADQAMYRAKQQRRTAADGTATVES